jgi:hypothetical protein
MILRFISTWIAVIAAAAVSFFSHNMAHITENLCRTVTGGAKLPWISEFFYPDAIFIYLFPIPLAVWALIYSFKFNRDAEHGALLRTMCLSLTVVFISLFICAIALPLLPWGPKVLKP